MLYASKTLPDEARFGYSKFLFVIQYFEENEFNNIEDLRRQRKHRSKTMRVLPKKVRQFRVKWKERRQFAMKQQFNQVLAELRAMPGATDYKAAMKRLKQK